MLFGGKGYSARFEWVGVYFISLCLRWYDLSSVLFAWLRMADGYYQILT